MKRKQRFAICCFSCLPFSTCIHISCRLSSHQTPYSHIQPLVNAERILKYIHSCQRLHANILYQWAIFMPTDLPGTFFNAYWYFLVGVKMLWTVCFVRLLVNAHHRLLINVALYLLHTWNNCDAWIRHSFVWLFLRSWYAPNRKSRSMCVLMTNNKSHSKSFRNHLNSSNWPFNQYPSVTWHLNGH